MATNNITSDWISIEVRNWEKYNPRNDRKMHTWFRLQNDIITDPKFHGLSAGQKFCAVCLLAEVSRSGGKKARVSIPWIADQLKLSREEVEQTVAVMLGTGILTEPTPPGNRSVTSGDRSVSDGSTTDGRTDGRNEHNVPDPVFARETRDQDTGPEAGMDLRPGDTGTGPGLQEPEPVDFAAPELVAAAIDAELNLEPAPEPTPPAPAAVACAPEPAPPLAVPPAPAWLALPSNVIVGRFPAWPALGIRPSIALAAHEQRVSERPKGIAAVAPSEPVKSRVIAPVRPTPAVAAPPARPAPPGNHKARGYFVASDYDGPPTVAPNAALRAFLHARFGPPRADLPVIQPQEASA